jgi:hypothetical protein
MTQVEKYLKELHGKWARINTGGIEIGGAIEQKCKMEFIQHFGLTLSCVLQYNSKDPVNNVNQILIQNREGFDISYDSRDRILDVLTPFLQTLEVRVGNIYPHNIKEILSIYDDKGNITGSKLIFKDGSITNIAAITDTY